MGKGRNGRQDGGGRWGMEDQSDLKLKYVFFVIGIENLKKINHLF